MAYQYMESLPGEARSRYQEKLNLIGLDKCPYQFASTLWRDNPLEWPPLEMHDLYTYLIQFPGTYSGQAMKNYKSLEAYRFFIAGWTQNVVHMIVGNHIVLKANVRPSYRVTESPHHPWVAITNSGIVVAAHCDCMAGLGEACSHVGSVLYKLEAAVRLGYTSQTCTDRACTWNQNFTQNVEGHPAAGILLYQEKVKGKIKSKPRNPVPRATSYDAERLLNAIAANCGPVSILGSYAEYADRMLPRPETLPEDKVPRSLRDVFYSPHNSNLSPEQLVTLIRDKERQLKITTGTAEYIERITKAQASCSTWHLQRAGRITSSVAHTALHTKLEKPSRSLLKKICKADLTPLHVPAVVWGRDNEEAAFQLYAYNFQGTTITDAVTKPTGKLYVSADQSHSVPSLQKSGLVMCEDVPYLAASPDGIIHCECCGKGVLEIKCPYKHQDSNLTDMLSDSDFCIGTDMKLKENSPFYAQVQLQQYVCNGLYADLCLWTTKDCIILRIKRDDDFIVHMVAYFRELWRTAIAPELATRRIENDEDLENIPPVSLSTPPLYCVCDSMDGESEDMVCCDQCDVWFHIRCLKLKKIPRKASWFCPSCRRKRTKNKPGPLSK